MYGGTPARLPSPSPHERRTARRALPDERAKRHRSRLFSVSGRCKLSAVAAAFAVQILVWADGGIDLDVPEHTIFVSAPDSDRRSGLRVGAAHAQDAAAVRPTLPAGGPPVVADQGAAEPGPRPTASVPADMARCLDMMKLPAHGGPSRRTPVAPDAVRSIPAVTRDAGTAVTGPENTPAARPHASDRCAALMGLILLGAGDPKLRFR